MNKATTKAVETAKKAAARITVPTGPDFERSVSELAGLPVNKAELKKAIDELMAARAAELSSKLMSTYSMVLGL